MGFGACMLMQQLWGQCIESPDRETSLYVDFPASAPQIISDSAGGGRDLSSSSLCQGLPCCRAGRTHTTLSPLFLAPLGDPQPFPGF